ncbi:hypothetical protein ACFUJR_11370 [Streptomyces sp. NPDC057271]|uniref:hypothetical protein n=1 Tax=unclassified Streptomyces TaxID=2593676 RepID=UPI0036347940
MLRTRIVETVAVAVVALGAVFVAATVTVAPAEIGLVAAVAPVADTTPTVGTDNMTWQ